MYGNPDASRHPPNCYVHAEVEHYVSKGESPASIFAIPSILYSHIFKESQRPPFTCYSSNTDVYAPALVTQVPSPLSPFDLSAQIVPNVEQSDNGGIVEDKHKLPRSKRSSRKSRPHGSFWCDHHRRTFTRKGDLVRHMETVPPHATAKPYACGLCPSAFPRRDARDVRDPLSMC